MVGQQTERVFMQKQPSEGFFDKGVMRNFAKFTRKVCTGILFWYFFVNFAKFEHFFAEKDRTAASDCSSINSSKGSTGKRNCKL